MKKYAFTLAEVLITLGIIGIVAALIMPGLIANHQKKVLTTQITRASNRIQNAAKLYMAKEEISDFFDGNGENPAAMNAYLNNFMKTAFKVAKDCTNDVSGCFAASYGNISKGYFYDGRDEWKNCFTLASGESVCIFYSSEMDISRFSMMDPGTIVTATNPAAVVVDTNGKKGPNTLGRDLFVMALDSNGVLQPFVQEELMLPGACKFGLGCDPPTSTSTTCQKAIALLNLAIGSGLCFESIRDDGWAMNY